jgi:hypothetical protein
MSLSTQNRNRIKDCLNAIETSLVDDAELLATIALAKRESENLEGELSGTSHKTSLAYKSPADKDFSDCFMSSGCFSNDIQSLKEGEGASWGTGDLQTLAELLNDSSLSFSSLQKQYFKYLAP